MFKKYFDTIKKYFHLQVISPRLLTIMLISALLRTLAFVSLPFIASSIVDAIVEGEYSRAQLFAAILLATSLTYLLFRHIYLRASLKLYNFSHHQFQQLMLKKVAAFDQNYVEDFPPVFVTNAAFSSISYAPEFPSQLINLSSDIFALLLSTIILFIFDPIIGWATLAFMVIAFIALVFNLHKYEYYARLQLNRQDEATDLINEVIDGRREVKVFNLRDELDKVLHENQVERRQLYDTKGRYRSRARIAIPALLGLGRILIYLLAIALIVSDPDYNVSALVLAVGYYADVEGYFTNIRQRFIGFSANIVHIQRIYRILSYRTHANDFGIYDRTSVSGKIEVVNLSFNSRRRQVFKNLNFAIQPHSLVVITGKSGSGKSILLKLLSRLHKPTRGKVLLDDININRYTKAAYADNVVLVAQKPFIFDLSIRENLNLIDENPSHQIAACQAVGLHDDIMKMPDGYDTKLAADAADFSPAQKQLFALARTLLSGVEVLLLDDITAALDVKSSTEIYKILAQLKKTHTVIVATHDQELIKRADEEIKL